MRLTKDTIVAVGIILLLAIVTVAAAFQQRSLEEKLPPLSSDSNQPDGARALRLWLESLGHQVTISGREEFSIPNNIDFAFILEPGENLTLERSKIDLWVEDGGTLLLAGESWAAYDEIALYGFTFGFVYTETSNVSVVSPALCQPPLKNPLQIQVSRVLEYNGETITNTLSESSASYSTGQPLLVSTEGIVAVQLERGRGHVILLSVPELMSNSGLKKPGASELIQNLLGLAQGEHTQKLQIWIDEWHHGQRSTQSEVIGPEAWLRRTPAGQSILFTSAVIFIALAIGGKSFGKPLTEKTTLSRRAPLEYITALANLSRRAGHRNRVLQAEYVSLKKQFARRYHIPIEIPDFEFVQKISLYSTNIDTLALQKLLLELTNAMNNPNLTEAEMLHLVGEIHQWRHKEQTHLSAPKGK